MSLKKSVLSIFTILFVLTCSLGTVNAELRSGIDCECTKTGGYKNPTRGKAPSIGISPAYDQVTGLSPGGDYRVEITSGGGYTFVRVYTSGESLLYDTSYLAANITTPLPEQDPDRDPEDPAPLPTPVKFGIAAGFSPDDDRFVYHYIDTSGFLHVKLIDLASSSQIVTSYDRIVTGARIAFSPKGGNFLFYWSTSTDLFFEITNSTTGDVVFDQDTAADFDLASTPWGFSPDGNLFLYHYVSAVTGSQRHYIRLYDLAAPSASLVLPFDRSINFSDPRAGATLRFAPKSDFLLYAADGLTSNETNLEVFDTSNGNSVWQDSFIYSPNIGEVGDKFKGATWGFSNETKNLNLIYAVDSGLSDVNLNLIDLAAQRKTLFLSFVDIVSGFWQFSPCGDMLAVVNQGNGGQLQTSLYETVTGALQFSQSQTVTTLVSFITDANGHWVSVDGGDYSLMVVNNADESCVPRDTTPPDWPSNASLTLDSQTETSISFSWPAATDAVSYVLYKDDVQFDTTTNTSYTATDLEPETGYLFRVEAEDAAGNPTIDGPSDTFTTDADTTPPEWPAGSSLTETDIGCDWVLFSWNDATDAETYTIFMDGSEIAVGDKYASPYFVYPLEDATTYTFKVEAVDASGNSTVNGPELDISTEDCTDPEWPENSVFEVTGYSEEGTSLTLGWTPATDTVGVDHYELRMDGQDDVILPSDVTTHEVTGLELGQDYSFYLYAYDAAGNRSRSQSLRANTDGTPPSWIGAGLYLDAVTSTSMTVRWDPAVDNVALWFYALDIDGILIDEYIDIAQHTFTIECLVPDTTYTVKVEAKDTAGNVSIDGPQISVTTDAGPMPATLSTSLESVSSAEIQGDSSSNNPSISDYGRYVVFQSGATNLVPGDANDKSDIFVRDLQAGTTERVSVNSVEEELNGHSSGGPEISSDGRFVVFQSSASNVVEGYSGSHIYIRDRLNSTTKAVDITSGGGVPNGGAGRLDMTPDGRLVFFNSSANNILPSDINTIADTYLRNMVTDEIRLVSVSASGVNANDSCSETRASRDGRYVVLECIATNLVDGEVNEKGGIYFKDMQTGIVEMIAANVLLSQYTYAVQYFDPVVSDDGRYISYSANHSSDTSSTGFSVWLYDRQTSISKRLNATTFGESTSSGSSISADGRYVAFGAWDGPLPGDTNGDKDILLYDQIEDSLSKVSVCSSGGQVVGNSWNPVITADGKSVVFHSDAINLVPFPQDANGASDVFVHTIGTITVTDTDNDGIPDDIEDANQNGIVDAGETDPNNPDTDGDGFLDGVEDANHNGRVDPGETDPTVFDTDEDGDGVADSLDLCPGYDDSLDADGDGLADCIDGDDSDGDGFTDAEEVICGSDPADFLSRCRLGLPWLMLLLGD